MRGSWRVLAAHGRLSAFRRTAISCRRSDSSTALAYAPSSRPRARWSATRSTTAVGHDSGWHQHPRAQLLHAIDGVMRVATEAALFIVPPGTGLWMPARTLHLTRMPPGLRMRALFLREDAAAAGPRAVTVVAVSPLLRELILTACEEPVMWDENGPVRHVVALALHEIGRADTRPISVPACRDPRLQRVTEALLADPADQPGAGGVRRHGRRFGAHAGAVVPARDRDELPGLAAAVAADRGAGIAGAGRDAGASRGCGRLCQRAGIRRRVPIGVRHHAGTIAPRQVSALVFPAQAGIPGVAPEFPPARE